MVSNILLIGKIFCDFFTFLIDKRTILRKRFHDKLQNKKRDNKALQRFDGQRRHFQVTNNQTNKFRTIEI